MKCPLSGKDGQLAERVRASDLVRIYEGKLKISIGRYFEQVDYIDLFFCNESGLLYCDPCITGDARFYSALQSVDNYYMAERPEFLTALKYLGQSVLEVGCGSGRFAEYVGKARYKGLELNVGAVEEAQKKGVDVTAQQLKDYLLSESEIIDTVCVFQVLEHVENPADFIADCVRSINKGYLIFSLPDAGSFMCRAKNNPLNLPPHHVTWWTEKTFRYIEKAYGLELVELKKEPMEEIHKIWFFKVVIRDFVMRLLGRKVDDFVDMSLLGRIVDKLTPLPAWMLKKVFCHESFYPTGHTITAVYRKK